MNTRIQIDFFRYGHVVNYKQVLWLVKENQSEYAEISEPEDETD